LRVTHSVFSFFLGEMDSKRKNPQEIFRMEGEGEVKSEEKGGQEGPQR
jgi:hypothetical protein